MPLTPAQERLWFLERAGFDGATYHNWFAHRLRGPLDAAALSDAMALVLHRHDAMRTAIVDVGGRARQVVHDRVPGALELVELPAAGGESRLREFAAAFVRRPFDLARPPLLRAALVRRADDDHVLVVCVHHIVADGTGIGILMAELFTAYGAAVEGNAPRLPAPGVPFADYAAWLAGSGADRRAEDREYWRTHLAGALPLSTLPADRPRPASPSLRSGRHSVTLDADLVANVRTLARAERCTPFALYLAALSAVLARHTGEEDLVIGTPADNRHTPELERTVGMFANTLALRTRLEDNPTLRDVLRTARRTAFGGVGHRMLPFDVVVDLARVHRGLSHNPLFQVMLVVEPDGYGDLPLPPGLHAREWELGAPPARFDLTLIVVNGPRVTFVVDYAAELYEPETIARFTDHLIRLLAAFASEPGQRLWDVDLAGDAHAAAPPLAPPAPFVTDLIAESVSAHPDSVAVRGDDASLTYAELGRRSTALAARLRELGTGPEDVVAVVAPSTVDSIVALLAVLRTGGAYLPVDPTHPPGRVARLLADAGVRVAIAAPQRAAVLAGFTGTTLSAAECTAPADLPAGSVAGAEQLAYLIYTSGSTGRPKGVQITHGTLARLTRSFVDIHRLRAGDVLFMVPPLTFDASVGDVFPALAVGATLVLHPEPARLDGPALLEFTARHAITAIDVPVSLWRRWIGDFATGAPPPPDWSVSTVMVGGERVPNAAVRAWIEVTGGRVALFNHYGPTEATVCATTHHVPAGAAPEPGTHLPIGRPLPHVRAYVLGRYGSHAPIGAPGELHLGGDCLARGYLHQPELTAERFPPDPFAPQGNGRMYRTGDLVRRRADGVLEFLGRVDRQVKINGHRIEPAEVEASVAAHPEVTDAAVIAGTDPAGRDRLLAYVVTGDGRVPHGLRRFLRAHLPDPLIPSVFTAVPAIRRTAHGKLDEAALPPVVDPAAAPVVDRPQGTVETAVADAWERVLGVSPGRHDNFFALGGHSLLVAGVLAEVHRVLGVELPLRVMFETADLAEFARTIAGGPATDDEPDLRAEAVLPEDIVPAPARIPAATGAPTILLTGATGFLGAYLVAELIARTDATLVCLTRADEPAHAVERVQRNLRRYGLEPVDPGRLVGLPGDLGAPGLGLAAADLADLAARVDVVCHNGGLVHFGEPYHRLRPVNVDSTVELLRLAARAGGVPVHLVSTLGVYLGKAYLDERVREQDPPEDPTGVTGGYNRSKWVADALARQARQRWLPVSVHRPARVSGHSRTGAANPDDHFSRTLATCVRLGMVPDLPYEEDLAPVDYVAAGIARAVETSFVEPDAADHHYFNPATISYAEIAAALREHGHPVALVPWKRWRATLLDARARGEAVPLDPFVAVLPEETPQHRRPRFDCSGTERALAAAGITCPPADRALLRRQLDALTAAGLVPPAAAAASGGTP
ncbi:non-ribosomal peptide synthetase [Virgisporangium aliadipatigenens]|uniref:non-ribosomal peptide synthetase n=1 Tax=Virgisporangium aliadipatigenens TaxID=741659 RepID=UPI001944F884|nr:non-ribosomal peptide synthetase [Virgisporangium aliadipatigenens]